MKITKKLKHATFEWNDEQKDFTLSDNDGNELTLNKVYSFAFMRFVIRISQRNWLRTKKIVDTPSEDVLNLPEIDAEAIEDLQQSLIFEDNESKLSEDKMDELLVAVREQFGTDSTTNH